MAPPSPDQIYRAQQSLTRRLVAAIAPVLAPLLGVRKSAKLNRAIARAVYPYVQSGRKTSRDLARLVYVQAKANWNSDASPIEEPRIRDYPIEALEKAVSDAMAVNPTDRIEDADLERVAAAADSHVRNAYRNQSLAYVHNDNDIVGWARVDPYPPTCELCRLLISRGPVYKTARSAGERNKYHTGCTCVPQLVFKGQEDSWPGREIYLAERERYEKATRGLSGKDARRAWRKAVDRANSPRSVQERESQEHDRKSLPE